MKTATLSEFVNNLICSITEDVWLRVCVYLSCFHRFIFSYISHPEITSYKLAGLFCVFYFAEMKSRQHNLLIAPMRRGLKLFYRLKNSRQLSAFMIKFHQSRHIKCAPSTHLIMSEFYILFRLVVIRRVSRLDFEIVLLLCNTKCGDIIGESLSIVKL
jgi:hypothetical protein